jgi:hypothetical protein
MARRHVRGARVPGAIPAQRAVVGTAARAIEGNMAELQRPRQAGACVLPAEHWQRQVKPSRGLAQGAPTGRAAVRKLDDQG